MPKGVHGLDGCDNALVAFAADSSLGVCVALWAKRISLIVEKLWLRKGFLAIAVAFEARLVPLGIERRHEKVHNWLIARLAHNALLFSVMRCAKETAVDNVKQALNKVLLANGAVAAARVHILDTLPGNEKLETPATAELAVALVTSILALGTATVHIDGFEGSARIFGSQRNAEIQQRRGANDRRSDASAASTSAVLRSRSRCSN